MTENTSPEEKLFNIIQQEKGSSRPPDSAAPKKDGAEWIGKLKRSFAAITFPGHLNEVPLKVVNVMLFLAELFLILFVIYYGVTKYPNIAKIVNAAVKAQHFLPPVNREVEELHPLSYYTEDARQRDIFNSVRQEAGTVSEPIFSGSSAGGLKLQGIAWSDTPKVMIQIDKDNKLYILKQGQAIGTTGIKVKTILRNKAILTSGGRDFEI